MPNDSRSRTISFRFSETDYHECRRLCLEQGVASVSEVARAAIKCSSRAPSKPRTTSSNPASANSKAASTGSASN